MKLPKEPCGQTCPQINSIIETITSIVKEMDECHEDMPFHQLFDYISEWKSELADIGVGKWCELEDLRHSNADLRSWGEDLITICTELESEKDAIIEDLQNEIYELEYKIKHENN